MTEPTPQADPAAATTPRYPVLLVDVPAEEADDVGALLFELGAEGIEQRDDTTLARGEQGGCVTLVASFADDASVARAISELDPGWSPRASEILGDEWRDAYKQYFHPFRLTQKVVVFPPWERAAAERPDDILLELEPGRAFGTGLHATTRGVSLVLEERAREVAGARVLDVGTGSGILLLVAAGLGAASGLGVDVDVEAVACARENAGRNGMQDRLTFESTPLEAVPGTWDVVLANIEARTLVTLAGALVPRVRAGGMLVLAGVLTTQKDDVLAAYASLALEREAVDGEWSVLVLRQPAVRGAG